MTAMPDTTAALQADVTDSLELPYKVQVKMRIMFRVL